jgi:serine phosphatase RsbU (regulator of sigma subunit)
MDELRRLLGPDASRAWGVLTREYADQAEPEGRVRRLWHRARIFFLGLSYKLSPARRVLFAASLLLVGIGMVAEQQVIAGGDVSPPPLLLVMLGVVGLVFLLALELADRVLVRDELEVARQLQRELLPAGAPDLPGWSFAHSWSTANTIGGDYYDFISTGDGRIALVAGDASGHGIAAGLLMALASSALKLAMDVDPDPVAVARLVNRSLCRSGGTRAFMTLFYGLLEPVGGRFEYVCAGHPFPLLRRSDGSIEELGSGCLPLGLREELEPACGATTLRPGDLLVLYSDGIPEAVGPTGTSFGFLRVRDAVAPGGSPQEVHDRVLMALGGFVGEVPAADDRTLVVVRREG